MSSVNCTCINNINVFPFKNKQEILDYITDNRKIYIAINAEKILKNTNEKLVGIINNNVGYPDGVGAVMALNQRGYECTKIPGVELWLDIIERYYKTKSFYFIGSAPEVINKVVDELKQKYSGINITGYRDGYFKSEEEYIPLIEDIKVKKPDVIFVAMGSPKQEFLMAQIQQAHEAIYMGLGGSFDIFSGMKKRAPAAFLNLKLEWLYRLLKEPFRIKRQLVLVKFFCLLLLKKL